MRALVQKWTRTNRFIGLALVILALMFGILPMDAQPSPPSRPILFVHGWCDSAFGWASLFAANSAFWQKLPTGLYTNQTVYIVEYDSGTGTIGFWAQTNPGYGANRTLNPLVQIPAASIPPSARFFAINFYDPNPQVANPTDPAVVTDVSILNKANEISVVLRNIESITGVNKVNIIAHSMGGLDSRAYVENLASIGACYNDSNLSNSYPDYSATNCSPGSAPYRGDVANIITLDTPHAGSELATPNSELVHLGIVGTCTGYPSTNMDELLPQSLGGAGLIEGLNFDGLGVNTSIPTQNLVPIQAIQDFFTDLANTKSWDLLPGESDDIVTRNSQAITADSYTSASNLPAEDSSAPLQNIAVPYLSTDATISNTSGCWDALSLIGFPVARVQVLHYLSCIGALSLTQTAITNQLINDTVPWISSWLVTPTTLTLGQSVSVSYSASDFSVNTLTRAELWRAPDAGGVPGSWSEVGSTQTLPQVTFTDIPTTAGKYWYGTHLFDSAGNEALEPSSVQVTVSAAALQAPTVTTGSATSVSSTNATLNGTVNPNGTATQYQFLYGTSQTLAGSSVSGPYSLASGTSSQPVYATISGLSAGKTYYYELQSWNSANSSSNPTNGGILSFNTPSAAKTTPTVSVTPASQSITTAQALSVTVSVSGSAGTPTGSVTLSGGGYTSSAVALVSGSAPFNIPAGQLLTSSDTLTATYTPGTSSSSIYNGATGTATVSVSTPGKLTPTVAVTPLSTSITTAQSVTVNVSVYTSSGPSPTGTVTVTIGSYTSQATPLTNASASINISGSSLSPGTYTPTAHYSGDTNFNSASGTANNSVTVTAAPTATLSVSVTGSGRVTSTDGHINCPGTCSYGYAFGASVLLISNVASGYYSQWSGCDGIDGTTGGCMLTMNQSRAVSIVFTQQPKGIMLILPGNLTFSSLVLGSPGTMSPELVMANGGAALDQVFASVSGPNASDFAVMNLCQAYGVNSTCYIDVTFTPSGVGTRTASFTVSSANATVTPQVYSLSGVGVVTPTVQVTASSSAITATQAMMLDVSVTGNYGTPTGSLRLNGGGYNLTNLTLTNGSAVINIPAGSLMTGSDPLYVYYTPDTASSTIYNQASAMVSVTVAGATSYNAPTEPTGTQSATQTATVLLTSGLTLGSIGVTTLGTPNLDFNYAPGGTCSVGTAYTAGQTCTVNYTFTPSVPGTMMGAINVYDNASPAPNMVATVFLNGNGTGPLIAFPPGIQSTVLQLITQLNPGGIAVDGSGNLYIADYDSNLVLKEMFSGGKYTESTIGSGWYSPRAVAVDGSGNLYVAESGMNRVVMETPSAGGYVQSTVASGLGYPSGVAVDGSGNVYIADSQNNQIRMETLTTGGYVQSTIPTNGLNWPNGIAVDGSGNIYIADQYNNRVLKETLSAGSYTQSTIISGLNNPRGVAVDTNGDIYIADSQDNQVLKETLSTNSYTESTIGSGVSYPCWLSLDRSGNLYISGNNLLKEDVSDPPSVNFATTNAGSTSGDSPQTVTLSNVGNAALIFPIPTAGNNPSIATNFTLSSTGGTACPLIGSSASSAGTLAMGASCILPISFAPTAAGSISGSLVLTDNNLNGTNIKQTISLSGTATQALQMIAFTPPSSPVTYGISPITLSATGGGSGNPVTFSVVSGPGTISGSTLTITGFGTIVVAANQAGNTNYAAATQITQSIVVNQATPTITFTVPNHTYGDAAFNVSATSNSSGAITYSVVSGPATISGSTVTLTGAGTVVLQASQVASGNYAAKTQTATFTVAGQAPTITFTVPNHTYGDAPFTVSATSSSTGAVTYSVVSGPATISGSTVTLTGAGTVVLQASQAAAGNYTAGTQTATFTVAGNAPTISFTVPNHTYGDAPFTVTATSNSSGAITYSVVSGPATISGSTVTLTNAGTVVLQASQAAAGNYTAGTQTATVTVAKESQTITFSAPASPVNYGVAPITLSASASSGLAVALNVVSGPGTISGSTLTITGAGTVVVAANQAGNTNYAAATQVTQSIVVNQASQTINFTASTSPVTYGVSPIALVATGGASGNAVVFSVVSGPATVSGSTLTITGAGTVVVAANQTGNTNYAAATQVTQSIVVNQASQTITFTAPTSPVTYGVSPITLSATSTSGLAVTFSVVSGPGTISGSTLTITGVGTVVVAANQAGNANYSAATQAMQSIVVNVIGVAATPTFSPVAGTYTAAQTVTISDATSGATIYYTTNGTTPTTSSTAYSGAITVSSTETLEAIATTTGYSTSAVASAAYTINIPTNPVPAIGGISPAFTNAGGAVFTLTINGSGFIASSTVYWGTSALTTTHVSATQITAQVPAADTAAAGTNAISVQNPAPGGGTSNAWQFEVDSASSGSTAPTITSTTETVAAGSTASYPVTVPSSVTSVYVTCLNLPTGASCSYSSTTNTVTIATSSTTPTGTYQIIVVFAETVSGAASGFILLPILLLPLGFMRRKLAARGIWLTACLGLVLMATAALSVGCGGGSSGGSGSTTPPATHQVTSSGAVSLTVQ